MIRNEQEYQLAVKRLQDEKARIDRQRMELSDMGLAPEEIQRAVDPLLSFHLQLQEEAAGYERLKRREIAELCNLRGFGDLLIGLRIAAGITQRQLAEKLDVHESQVSRDERNEYHGITLERAAKILDALGAKIRIQATVGTGDDAPDDHLVAT